MIRPISYQRLGENKLSSADGVIFNVKRRALRHRHFLMYFHVAYAIHYLFNVPANPSVAIVPLSVTR